MPFSFCRICPSMCGRRSRALLSGGSACCSYFRRRESIDRCQSVNCQSSGCGQLRSTVHCLESVRMDRLWRPRSYDVVICLSFYWLFLWHVIVTCTSHELGCCRRVISCISCGRVVKSMCCSNVRLLCGSCGRIVRLLDAILSVFEHLRENTRTGSVRLWSSPSAVIEATSEWLHGLVCASTCHNRTVFVSVGEPHSVTLKLRHRAVTMGDNLATHTGIAVVVVIDLRSAISQSFARLFVIWLPCERFVFWACLILFLRSGLQV